MTAESTAAPRTDDPLRRISRALLPRGVRNALRAPGKSAAWAWDELRHRAGANVGVEVRPGWTPKLHPAAARFVTRHQVRDPEQAAELDRFIAACTPGMAFVDVGAHFGVMSLAALHFGGPRARAVAVEPSPAAVRMLRAGARLNGVADRLRILPAAVSDADGALDLVSVGVLADGFFVRPDGALPESERTRTRALTLDSLVKEARITPTHVKIDVEGGEAAVLRGARRTLGGERAPVLFLEVHGDLIRSHGGSVEEVTRQLAEMGYEMRALDGTRLDAAAVERASLLRLVAERA